MKRNDAHQGPMNVRFTPETRCRLQALKKKTGIKVSKLVRAAVEDKLDEWERKGVRIAV